MGNQLVIEELASEISVDMQEGQTHSQMDGYLYLGQYDARSKPML